MRFDERVNRALVPLVCAVFSAGAVAVIFAEMGALPMHVCVMLLLVPAVYAVLSVLTMTGVLSRDGAVLWSLVFVPVVFVFAFFLVGILSFAGIDGIG